MPIAVKCDDCNRRYQVGDDKAGRRFVCQRCSTIVTVPGGEEDEFGAAYARPSQSTSRRGRPTSKKAKKGGEGGLLVDWPYGLGWWATAWKRWNKLEGRARRREYWFFTLIQILLYVPFLGLTLILAQSKATREVAAIPFVALMLFFFAAIVPQLCTTVRRLHDTGRSGYWIFANAAPNVAAILLSPVIAVFPMASLLWLLSWILPLMLLVFLCLDSDPRKNQYGRCPK